MNPNEWTKWSKTLPIMKLINAVTGANAGTAESTMDLHILRCEERGYIEWDLPKIEDYYCIGLWFDDVTEYEDTQFDKPTLVLTDCDGIHCLPAPAVVMLREAGVFVPEVFE